MRIAVLDREKCQPKKCGYVCMQICPGLRMKEETIRIGEKNFPVFSEELCTGCGLCIKKCPFKAINIINLPEEIGKPVHQFGVNGFRVYNLPCPKKGVVGLIGPNGIGKTTILRILSGKLVPNLGEKPDWKTVLEKFKGKEIQKYLEKISKKEIRLAYKPQEVDRIPEMFKGKVKEFLKKFDEKKIAFQLAAQLELNCLEKKLSEISGGELQRTAIIAIVSRKADFYFFDEPSSFLDISQRLKAAKIIRELGKEACVFVVEHDLAVLDYLTDYVCILYGRPGAYGVVSGVKSSRTGLNEFLNGFLKAENTRIRDYSIRFEVKPPATAWKGRKSYSYASFKKKYPGFELEIEKGELRKGEVVGILGRNAIGKTTYMEVLAGVEKPSQGSPGLNVKIAYKPQYISIDFPGTVLDLINTEKDLDRELFESEIRKTVEDLFLKEIKNLSGGELQRLAIAVALAKKCDVCLLDEPSAFLDIEQRLKLAQIIKRIAEKKEIISLVVEHDIVFQDMVANRILLFKGEPGVKGKVGQPQSMHTGMNDFLKIMNITMRRDKESGRPRINKPGSQLDEKQKKTGEYYYLL